MPPADNPSPREATLDQLLAEYLRRCDAEAGFDAQAMLAEHPDFAEELKELLDTADLVDHMAGPLETEVAAEAESGDEDRRAPAETVAMDARNHDPGAAPTIELSPGHPSLPVFDSSSGNLAGRVLGEFELLEMLGRGGMGVVYKARQISLDRIVALKMILAGEFASEAEIRRFYAEAQAAGKLGHPHIVNVYEMDEIGGRHYFTMEYVEGRTLAQEVADGPLPPERAARYLELIARAVQCAHEHEILHRDLKPANVLIDERDEPQITDFGLAKDLNQDAHFTASGAAVGTPSYMAPEQAAGRRDEIGPAADVYSLGAVLYEMLTGRPPFSGDSVVDIILDVIHKDPLPPHVVNPEVDRELETVCLKCLHKNPAQRYATAEEVADEMRRYLAGLPVRARRRSLAERAASWTAGVPLVAAMLGRRVYSPTHWQMRTQWLLIGAAVMAAALLAGWLLREAPLPPQIRIAAGAGGGMYHRVSELLAERLREHVPRPVRVLETAGAYANRELLQTGQAELGLLQSDALMSRRLAVVTPLYEEMVLVVVREGSGIESLAGLKGASVALGKPGSGTRNTALTVLEYYGIQDQDVSRSEASFSDLLRDERIDGAFVISGFDSPALRRLLTRPELKLLPIDRALVIAESDHSLKIARLEPDDVPAPMRGKIPDDGLLTLKTAAFLTVRADASPKLVRAALETIYRDEHFLEREQLIPLEQAAHWPLLPLHGAAEEFFEAVR
ncbi:MAG: TAXI family TRAP transporter solute-binding subunit [Planctomycetes bacterium]|nr:TAXI family TRAP transporter solute-binding subunit [Planctomycetota bacterium]